MIAIYDAGYSDKNQFKSLQISHYDFSKKNDEEFKMMILYSAKR